MSDPNKTQPQAGGPEAAGSASTVADGQEKNTTRHIAAEVLPREHPSSTGINVSVARTFLDAIDPERKRWYFRTFPNSGRSGHPEKYFGTLDEVADALTAANMQGHGVYVVINDGGQSKAEIERIVAVYADFDGAPLPQTFALEPHLIINTSPGRWHAYWVVEGINPSEFTPIQRSIAAKYGADKSVIDPSRVMRLPGFLHTKGHPFACGIADHNQFLPYTAEEVRNAFPVGMGQPQPEPRALLGVRQDGVTVVEGRHADLLKLSARLARMVVLDGMSKAAALAALDAESETFRWSRDVPKAERVAALDGALAKFLSGAWSGSNVAPAHADKEDQPELRPVDMGRLARGEFTPPAFIAKPLIPRKLVTLLGGHGGSGKSLLALVWAAIACCGGVWCGIPFVQCVVAFFSMEDDEDLVLTRLRLIAQVFELDLDKIMENLRLFDGASIDAALVAEEQGTRRIHATPMLAKVEAAAAGAGLIVVDNASDTFDGDENSRRHVRGFIRLLARIARSNDAGFLLVAHIDKQAALHGSKGNSYSGSTAWHNSARSRLALVPIRDSPDMALVHEKANLSARFPAVRMVKHESGLYLPELRSPQDAAEEQETIRAKDDAAVLEAIQAAERDGYAIPTAMSGSSTAIRALLARGDLHMFGHSRAGKDRIKDALLRLEGQGKIVRALYDAGNRNKREKWAVAPEEGPAA